MKTLLEGDDNTRFFHLVANGKHRKQHIYQLENDHGVIVGDEQMKIHITQYYKSLFGSPEDSHISLMEDQTHDIPQVTQEENDVLVAEFTETEVRRLCSNWNIIRCQDLMVSPLNSIKSFGH